MHIGLLGCGLWGRNILRDLLALGARVAVVDPDPAACVAALAAGASHAAAGLADASGVDGWIIATPATVHAASIARVAPAGVPILCEKPLCTSVAELEPIGACLRGPLHLMDVWRHHPAVERLAELVPDELLGPAHGLRLERANWTSPRSDVDSAWNLAPHELSIHLQVFGAWPQPRAALAEWLDGGIRSLWSHWTDPAGHWLASEVSNRSERRRREIRLHCAGGVWVHDGVQPLLRGYAGPADARLEAPLAHELPLSPEPALRRQLQAWLQYLEGGPEPRSGLAHGCRVVEAISALRQLAGAPP